MKILLVNDYGVRQGGAEILLLSLRSALRRLGHDARLFSSDAADIGMQNLADYTCHGTISRFRTLLQSANPWAAIRLRQVLAEFRPDVVHVQMFLAQLSPLILPLLRNVPAIYHVVWYRPICPLGTKMLPDRTLCHWPPGLVCHRTGCLSWRQWLPLMMQMKLWRRWRGVFDLIVANSVPVQERLLAEGIGPVEVLPNGFPAREPRSRLSSVPAIAFAGRLVREKGVDVLLRAFGMVKRQISAAKLLILGDGPERRAIESLITELGHNTVEMLGFQPMEEVERIFRESWVVAVPSIWQEPFGQVAIEAMMNGVAVVASASGGLSQIVRHGETGFLVPPGEPRALAAALLRILSDRELAEKMGRSAHQVAILQFNETQFVDRLLQFYGSICANGEAGR